MAVELIPANIECLAVGFQVDKDTPATVPVMAIALEDCTLDPGVDRKKQQESDQSAQEGNVGVMGAMPGGSFKKLLRPSEDDLFLYALQGKNVDSGTTPKIHTANVDPAAPFTTPYLTIWDIWPGEMCIRYSGCRLGSGHLMCKPGEFAEIEYAVQALKATYIDPGSAPVLTGLFATELAHSWAELTAALGTHDGTVNSVDLTINRGTNRFPGDNGFTSLDVPNGLLSVTGSMEVAFISDDLARSANTGTTTGTDLTSTVFTSALSFAFARGANLGVTAAMAAVQISNFKTQLKTDATPAVSTFDFDSKRQAVLSDAIQTVVKNAILHADRS